MYVEMCKGCLSKMPADEPCSGRDLQASEGLSVRICLRTPRDLETRESEVYSSESVR